MEGRPLIALRAYFPLLAALCLTLPAWAQTPTSLTVTKATSGEIDLTWSGTAPSYTVQRRPLAGSFTTIASPTQQSAVDTQIDAYVTYQYQVLGSGSATPSNQVTVGPPPQGFSLVAPAPVIGGSPVTTYGDDIAMTLDANGDPAFAFVFEDPNQDSDASDTEVLFRSWNRAQYSWNSVVAIATVDDIAATNRNSVGIAYDRSTSTFVIASEYQTSGGAGVKVFTSADAGKTWTLKQTYATNAQSYGPSVALAAGRIYLAFNVDSIGIQYYTGTLSADPSTWTKKTAPVPANTGVALFGTGPSLALDGSEIPAIAYWAPDTSQGYNEILFFWRPDSGGQPVKVTDSQNNQTDVAAVLHFTQTNPRILFHAQRNDAALGVGNHFVFSNDGGATWQAPVVIPPDGNSTTDFPFDMSLDSRGNAAVAFGQTGGSGDAVCGNPKLARSSDLVNWTTCAAADVSITGNFQVYPDSIALAFGGNDKLLMLWKDTANNGNGVGVFLWREQPAGAATAPSITDGGVVSDATGLPGIVSGSWVTVYGANFADVPKDWSASDFSNGLPTSLEGIQVMMNNLPAAVYFVNATQVNAQAPAGLSGNVLVQVIKNGAVSNTVTAQAVAHAPGLFAYSLDYKTFYPSAVYAPSGVIVGDPAVAGNSVAKAHPGDYILLFATGLGPSAAGQVVQGAIPFPDPVTVKIGNVQATVLGSAYLIYAGEYQINIQVPGGLTPGTDYPIVLSTDGASTQSGVVLPIAN